MRNYRSTPHTTTGIAPSVLLFGEDRTNRLPTGKEKEFTTNDIDKAKETDRANKEKIKDRNDKKRRAWMHDIKLCDRVLLMRKNGNQFDSKYDEKPYRVIAVRGTMITASSDIKEKTVTRNVSKFKRAIDLRSRTSEVEEERPNVVSESATKAPSEPVEERQEPRYPSRYSMNTNPSYSSTRPYNRRDAVE